MGDPGFLKSLVETFFGAADGLLYALVAATILDYITGICVAINKGRLSSDIGAKGISKKVAMFALISVGHLVDSYLISSEGAVRTITTSFYLLNECVSVLENASNLGLPLPTKLTKIIRSAGASSDPEKK